jgi:hypothetical protein
MNLYKMTVTQFIEHEYEIVNKYFYRTESEMQHDKFEIERIYKRDGKWIPNITSVDFDFEEIDFEDAKDEMTIAQFEDLFDTVVFAE